ncbi:hypothetical protein A5482_014825 (plasmid) [Cyanobacterium sp. IPPAS B-1200]|uniref:hypothetical protein n=1 Tax=Cyanobacterium sp. IPPAS B-1200 TaxID=1562720 RepID=UPI000852725C|nr:hypothetical protein [Cyanobacterium sp. IPPAS B-1200]OEJ77730.1 hypothetical protein A5482_15130 [Cyanobacterium sp. IPPAS B-1200]
MLFKFPPVIEAGMKMGKYLQVFSSTGVPLGIARDAKTGQFIGHAVGFITENGLSFNPIIAPLQVANMLQTHLGFQAVQASLGALQATTAIIGVGVAGTVVLSAVNLYQTIKLRKAVERLELKVENGFIDLKNALGDLGSEIIEHIDQVASDLKFEQHRLILIRAYGLFTQALNRFNSAVKLQDTQRKNSEIDAARGMLFESLADYRNPQLLDDLSSCGSLRRFECSWLIERIIISTYEIQNELDVASERLYHLQVQLRDDSVDVLKKCNSIDELDFLFPEIIRLHNQDLVVLNSWQNNVDWMRSLSMNELELVRELEISQPQSVENNSKSLYHSDFEQLELKVYENLQEKAHFDSIRDQLIFTMKPQLRKDYEDYIGREAKKYNHQVFVPSNLEKISPFALSNLYWYFYLHDEFK